MKLCNILKATIWNESAYAIADSILEIDDKAKGDYLSLDTKNMGEIYILTFDKEPEESYSDRCFYDHSKTKRFVENPVVP